MAVPRRYRSLRLQVDAPDTARAARDVTALTLGRWGLVNLVPDVQLCASELIGNVALHALRDDRSPRPGDPRTLTVTWRYWDLAQFFDLAVSDDDSTPPTLPQGETFAPELAGDLPEALIPTHGRGLHIVCSIAEAVWWDPLDDGGKRVVCRFDTSGLRRPLRGQPRIPYPEFPLMPDPQPWRTTAIT
ncbi:ATP-binding protein [Streptacidiphilus sp. ASG 303]|uniref:ATP-binding protein n=1 Tax=Streptacidiphilus sp. ASG 303 TaxID=2896847 RepID=UPI001E64D3BA|nr:ATP-binding protein [Streptacidiphilus sp. ASG 303]MCD0485751.1 ATP-binding protein [Streptacidiphilus sp. ASG 303]